MLFFNVLFPLIKGGEGDVLAQSGEKWSFGLNSPSGNAAFGTSNYFPIIIKTNSTEKMRITESGNVGIGTIAPADKLHVAGTARMLNAEVENQLNALNVTAQNANFAVALVTGQLSAGSLTVSGNATINGNLSALGGLTTGNITSPSGNIDFGNNNLSTTGNVSSANISSLQITDSIFNSQFSILNSQVSSIQSSQWTTTQNGIEHNGNVFVKNLSVEESINIGSFRFSNGSKDTAIAPPPVIKDTIASDKPIVISAEKSISLNADTVLLGNGTGKVGIGIPPAPGEKLSVAGNVGVSGNLRLSNLSGTDERLLYVDSSGNLKVNPLTTGDAWVTGGNEISNGDFIGTTNSNDLVIKTNNLERMHITATGKVGIGTSNPQKRLHIWQTDDVNNPDCGTVLRLEYNVPNSPNGCQQSGSSLWDFKAKLDGNSNGLLTLNNASTSQVVLSFLHNGKVGIGTAAPIQMLDVNGRMNLSGGVIQKGGAPITATSDLGLYSLDAGFYMRFVTNGGAFRFYSDGGVNPIGSNALLSIESNGKVGIGTNNPQYKLDVAGPVNATEYRLNGVLFAQWQPGINPNDIYYDAGNVGIGTNNPQSKLDILDGSIHMNGDPSDPWTTSHWQPILKAPLGSVWRTTNKGMNNLYYLGFGMTTTGWYWSAASTANDSGDPWYPMSLTDGTPPTGWVLTVDGRIVTKVLDVAPDYVFKKDYPLLTVEQLKAFIDKEGHHPNFLSAKQYEQRGKYDLLEMDMNLLKTSEELTLYIIELKKMLDEQNKVIDGMKKEIEKLKKEK